MLRMHRGERHVYTKVSRPATLARRRRGLLCRAFHCAPLAAYCPTRVGRQPPWSWPHDSGSSAGCVLHGQTIASRVYLRENRTSLHKIEVYFLVCRCLCCPLLCLV